MAKAQAKSKRTTAKKTQRSAPARKSTSRKVTAKSSSQNKMKGNENKNGSLLQEFFMDSLKDIYWAEKALTKALPKMSKNATSEELKKAFDQHLEITKSQVERLEQVFEALGEKAQAKTCDAMKGLVQESESIIGETKDDTYTRDAALIMAAQKVEHYEIATYGGLVQLARTMNQPNIAKMLETTLNEEKEADVLLTKIAEAGINEVATNEEGGETKTMSLKESIMNMFSKNTSEGNEEKSKSGKK
ncbi:MAG TPA: ferritin-like domain-containing protein [Chryseosolibacter sp.]